MATDELQYGVLDASYRAAGGEAGLRRLAERFYEEMDRLPEAKGIREMHKPDLAEARDKLTSFLCGWLGGPRRYQEKYGMISLPRSHAPFAIGAAERDAWLLCMHRALEAQPYDPNFRAYLLYQLSIPAERVRNRE